MRLGVTGIHHIRLTVGDLEQSRQGWTRLGFALSPRGAYPGGGTPEDAILLRQGALRFLRENPRGGEVMWAVADILAAEAAFRELGLPFATHREVARQSELPEQTVVERFDVLSLPPAATPGLHGELWCGVPPALPVRPEWLAHPNGVSSLIGATVIVPDTAPLQESYERLFGPANVHTTDKVISVRSGRQRLLIASRDDFAAMHPEVEPDDSAGDNFIALVTLGVADLNQTTDHLVNWHIEHEAPGTGRLVVPPTEASGVILEFVRERR
ncbi:MAG: hypothetical protein JWL84_397 [Rhodospirillales bacterium]|jgi:catechol 2,3-dioxygenase-like lactoylglutathione lyase family enzyme|nr:hypothetical protein [Rhodospirillales bacterium]